MEEKTFIGMKPSVVFGLTWILFPFGIVALAVDHKKMTKNDKQQIVSAFVMSIIDSVLTASTNGNVWWFDLIGLPIYIVAFVFWLISMIKAFKGEDYHCPIAWALAGTFLKDDAKEAEAKPEEVTEEAPKEDEAKEE